MLDLQLCGNGQSTNNDCKCSFYFPVAGKTYTFCPVLFKNHNLSRRWVTFLMVTTMKLTILLHPNEYQRNTERATGQWMTRNEHWKRSNPWKPIATLHGSRHPLSETPETAERDCMRPKVNARPFLRHSRWCDVAVSKMLSAYFQSPLCPFPENISNGV